MLHLSTRDNRNIHGDGRTGALRAHLSITNAEINALRLTEAVIDRVGRVILRFHPRAPELRGGIELMLLDQLVELLHRLSRAAGCNISTNRARCRCGRRLRRR
jgi:hypothetical protein